MNYSPAKSNPWLLFVGLLLTAAGTELGDDVGLLGGALEADATLLGSSLELLNGAIL